MKERVTLTVDASLLRQVDSKVDGTRVKNRSHAMEILLTQALGGQKLRTAFVLAGGKGTRIQQLSKDVPKSLLPIHGKPILEHLLELLKQHGITNIVLSVGHKADAIKQHFGNGRQHGVSITYVEEAEPLGTAGPLRLARHLLTDTFVMCNADELKEIDLHDMLAYHKSNSAQATIALTTVDNPCAYGVARLKGNQIIEFIEKPKNCKPSNLINAGLYVLEPGVIDLVPEGAASIERDVFPKLAQQGALYGYPFHGQWFDTGTPERYALAEKMWKQV